MGGKNVLLILPVQSDYLYYFFLESITPTIKQTNRKSNPIQNAGELTIRPMSHMPKKPPASNVTAVAKDKDPFIASLFLAPP